MARVQGPITEAAEEILRQRAESLARETAAENSSEKTSVLAFRLAEEWYGVRVSDVREIFQEYTVTAVPCVPEYVLGVVNVRGEILSVTDSAILMGLGTVSVDSGFMPPAIVVSDGTVSTALVVDEMGDILEIASEEFGPPVSVIGHAHADFVTALMSLGDKMICLINTSRVLEPIVSAPRL